MSLDQEIDSRKLALSGLNSLQLADRLKRSGELLDALATQKLISEKEKYKRGPYSGAVGYFSYDGNMDTAIAIRTAVIKNNKIHVGAGAGVVADSIPENEWNECLQKAHVFLDAIEMIK